MIDIHTHLLYETDDGCITIDETIELIKKAHKNGFSKIVFTPHYIEDSDFDKSVNENTKRFCLVKKRVEELGVDIELYLGNEIYATDNILSLIKQKKIKTINNSRYLLIEFPRLGSINDMENTVHNLLINNIVPIICHPERYYVYQKEPEKLLDLIKQGAVIQVNSGSLLGLYGRAAKQTVAYFLKRDYVHIMSTDCHQSDLYESIDYVKKILNRIGGNRLIDTLLYHNPNRVINNEEINTTIKHRSRGIFTYLRS